MTKLKTTLLISAISAGLLVSAASADPFGGMFRQGPPAFADLDTDGDGQITMTELMAQKEADFAKVDTNSDGGLSAEELIAAQQLRRAQQMIAMMDENDDGLIQIEEMVGPKGQNDTTMFERLDKDGDGAISEEEFEALADQMRRGDRRDDRRGDRRGHGGHGHRGGYN